MWWKLKLKPDPMGEERNPFQVYLLCLGVFSGISVLLTDVPDSAGSIESFLNTWEEIVWGWLLISGSTLALGGMYWQGDRRDGLLIKRLGFFVLSVPLMIYSIVLIGRFGVHALTLALIIAAYAAAALIQARRVNRRIRYIIERTEEDGTA